MLIPQSMVEAEGLSENYRYGESVFSAISVGVFFTLVGAIFVTTPDLFNKILDFFRDFSIVRAPNTVIFLPAPDSPSAHSLVYSAVTKYSVAWSFFQILVLALRFFAVSPLGKKAETVSNIVFWLGTSLLTSQFLNETVTVTEWFIFWSGIIILCGVSLIIRGVILAIRM